MALTDLEQGAYSGKDCYLYYNSGTSRDADMG